MIYMKIVVTLCAVILGVQADVGPGQNAYLPPDKGYKYPTPQKPFITPTRPTITRPTGTPSYTPTPTRPPPFVTPTPFTPSRPYPTPTRPYPTPSRPFPTPSRPFPTPSRPFPTPTGTPTRPPYRPPPIDGQPSDHNHVHDHHDHHDHHHHEPGMPFDFAYAVNDAEHGNDYSHNAISDGDITRGEYRIQLPDGRLQIVKYTADWKNGFNAQVSFEGQPSYPQPGGGGYKY